jgi:hypothetical protein
MGPLPDRKIPGTLVMLQIGLPLDDPKQQSQAGQA